MNSVNLFEKSNRQTNLEHEVHLAKKRAACINVLETGHSEIHWKNERLADQSQNCSESDQAMHTAAAFEKEVEGLRHPGEEIMNGYCWPTIFSTPPDEIWNRAVKAN